MSGTLTNSVPSSAEAASQEQADGRSPEAAATALARANLEPAGPDETEESPSPRARETRRALFRLVSASLVILTALFLMVLLAIRRFAGLG